MHLVTRLPTFFAFLICVSCASEKVPPTQSQDNAPTGGKGGQGEVSSSGGTAGSASVGTGGVAGTSASGGSSSTTGGQGGTPTAALKGCQAPGILFCDNFDKLAPKAEPAAPNWVPQPMWQNDRNKADNSQSHSPPNSVMVTPASYGSQMVTAMGFPPADNSFYVRVFMRLEKSSKDMGGHVSFIEGAEAVGDEGEELRLGSSHGIVDLNLIPGSKGNGSGEKTQFSNGDVDIPKDDKGVVLEAARWYCLEAHFDGKNHRFELWIDDKEQANMSVSDWKQGRMNWSPLYKFLKIGGQNFSGQMGRAWYDDVAVGTNRIGCS